MLALDHIALRVPRLLVDVVAGDTAAERERRVGRGGDRGDRGGERRRGERSPAGEHHPRGHVAILARGRPGRRDGRAGLGSPGRLGDGRDGGHAVGYGGYGEHRDGTSTLRGARVSG